ncbi:MAG TPA: hypothetical protein VGN90_06910 [Pyrinomonadaceae bacterium]|jgi:hypothetical protein|nr:hypothetical protein [Pyrinomonadaceae bacterium]
MKLTKIACVCAALLLTMICHGETKTRQITHADPVALRRSPYKSQTPDHGGKIESKYDGFSHETIITLNKMRVTCGSVKGNFKDVCVSFVAALHSPGIQLDYVRYARLQLIFQTKDWTQRHPLAERQLSVVADGETLRLGQMKLVSQSVNQQMTEVLEVDMPYAVFTKIARAQAVDVKVGGGEFSLREQNLAALRDLNNRVKF